MSSFPVHVVSVVSSMSIAVLLQSLLFAFMHYGSSSNGATYVGLVNLVVGGIASSINVFVTGNIYFSLGWHFGWNITMGHLLGLSTSGIPMSAKLVSIIPHPHKQHLHGGKFGPEQSLLAPLAYILGCIGLFILYYSNNNNTTTSANTTSTLDIISNNIWIERLQIYSNK